MAEKRVNPQLPSGTVPLTVSQTVPLAGPELVDPRTARFDTSKLAKGLEHFSRKAAERRADNQAEALLKGRQFAREHPEVFSTAKTDEELERALRNAVKDGAIPRGLLPSFQTGIRASVAENKLNTVAAQVEEQLLRYSGLDENGVPKDLVTVQKEVDALRQKALGAVPSSLLSDPDFGADVERQLTSIAQSARTGAFNKALSDRNNWAVKNAQESFQGVLDEVEGPLSPVEEEGLKAILNERYTAFKNRGVDGADQALVDAALLHATAIGSRSTVDALFFLESVGKFEINGQPLSLFPAMVKAEAALEDKIAAGDDRAEVLRGRRIKKIQAALNEASGDLRGLRDSGDIEGFEAGLRQAISELPELSEDVDGEAELMIENLVDAAERVPDRDMDDLISLMEHNQAPVPDDWTEVYGSRLTREQYDRMAAAFDGQQKSRSGKSINDRRVDRAVIRAKETVVTSGFSNASESRVNEVIATYDEAMRQDLDSYRMSLYRQGLSDIDVEEKMRERTNEAVSTFEANVDKVREQTRTMDEQRAKALDLTRVPTAENLSQAREAFSKVRGDFTPEVAARTIEEINRAQAEMQEAMDSLIPAAGNEFYDSVSKAFGGVLVADEEGNLDPAAVATLDSVFKDARANQDEFVKAVADKYGAFTASSAQAEIRARAVAAFNGEEGGTVSEVGQRIGALKNYYRQMESLGSQDRVDLFARSEDRLTLKGQEVARAVGLGTSFDTHRLGEIPDEEAAPIAAAFFATISDVQEGSLTVTGRRDNFTREYDLSDIDWKITPLANSKKGLIMSIPNDIDDRGAFLNQVGYLDEVFLEEDVRRATQEFINDQEVLIKLRAAQRWASPDPVDRYDPQYATNPR